MLHDFNGLVTKDRLRLPISVGSTLHAVSHCSVSSFGNRKTAPITYSEWHGTERERERRMKVSRKEETGEPTLNNSNRGQEHTQGRACSYRNGGSLCSMSRLTCIANNIVH